MTSTAHGAPRDVLVEEVAALSFGQAVRSYLGTVVAMADAELHRVRREPSVLIARVAQPLLWLLVFGAAVSRVRGLGSEGVPYKAFLVPGVLAQSVLFVAIFSGLAIIWERDLGITQRLLVAPVFRSAIIVGKAVSAAMRAVVQVCVVLVIVYLTGIPLQWSVPRILGAVATVGLCTILLSAVSSWGSAPTFWMSMSWCCSAGRWWRLPSPAAPSPAGSPENVSPGRRMCLWSAREGRCGHQARTEVRLFTPAS